MYMLLSNVTKGLDITDESFYILTATYPDKLYSTLTHEGYYTGLLFILANHSLSLFRAFGILLLLLASIWFALELYRYITIKFNIKPTLKNKLLFVVPISIGALSYYKLWLITPSYNWLALISVILFFTALFRIVSNKNINYSRIFTFDYLLISFSFSMAFFAKPTTALVLVCIALCFLLYERKNLNIKRSLPSIAITTVVLVITQILLFDTSIERYYERLTESMERLALLGGGHTLSSRFDDMICLINDFFFEAFYLHPLYLVVFIVLTLYIFQRHYAFHVTPKKWIIFMVSTLSLYLLFVFNYRPNDLWIRGVEFLATTFILIVLFAFYTRATHTMGTFIKQLWPLLIILLLGSFAYKFGSNNHIIYAMSGSMIFVIAAVLALTFLFDTHLQTKLFSSLSGLVFSLYILVALHYAYQHPYRLVTPISKQDQYVSLLGGLYVDTQTKNYIETLQHYAEKHQNPNQAISLIDMTGGSPGANVILDAEFFGYPWLLGGYPGSAPFVEQILSSYKGTQKLKNAWILTAPEGKRKLDLNILQHVGLNFPDNYQKIGTVQTVHRHEVQELWTPKPSK